jgi:hypothetical protein
MPARRLRGPRAVRALLLIAMWGLCWSAGEGFAAEAAAPAEPAQFERADVATIRQTTRDILADPRYAPRRSFWQWLAESLSRWQGRGPHLPPGLGAFLETVLVLWCLAALVAILVHIVWTIVMMVRAGRLVPGRGGRAGLRGRQEPVSYEDLLARMHALAGQGAFREALGAMMVALLRWLDRAGVLRFHTSKTNGDYLRDYPRARAGSGYFRRFVLAFDAMVYGGAACGPQVYERMFELFTEIQHDVQEEPQV